MSSWWEKSSSKDVKRKEKRKSIIDTIQRKLNRSRGLSAKLCRRETCVEGDGEVVGTRNVVPFSEIV